MQQLGFRCVIITRCTSITMIHFKVRSIVVDCWLWTFKRSNHSFVQCHGIKTASEVTFKMFVQLRASFKRVPNKAHSFVTVV